jgi:hypothetical protein
MKRKITVLGAFALVAAIASISAFAAVIVDGDGKGFVGKGDVQLAFDWTNKQLQDQAGSVSFKVDSAMTTVSEVSWQCNKFNNAGFEQEQQRARTTSVETTSGGILTSVARLKNQVTGFNLNGFNPDSTYSTSSGLSTEGPAVNSCATGWALDIPAGDPVVTVTGSRTMTISGPNGLSKTIDLE